MNSTSRTKRSIKGVPVNHADYTYVVTLLSNGQHKCGGSIVTQKLILTAAHCLLAPLTHVGVYSPCGGITEYPISGWTAHPGYNLNLNVNDIALLVLSQRIANAQIVSLQPKPQKVPDRSLAMALGWGMTEYGTPSTQLRKVEVPLLYPSDCQRHFGYRAEWVCIDASQRNVCYGDSGGPLVYNNTQIGVVSMASPVPPGVHPCTSGKPTVFTRISSYYNWIESYKQVYA
ncbi:hypothetical protein QAD02_004524 [Eretmocerus hayati]|uniref:Uncharacterized protein n=1 Tax=Eretmocerus hayati TaxID=131215 RepID=A0ACC2NQ76_9HYME|nr:hypothetical protein QAD02_004524 [Eretmocerus hayati]